MGYWLRVIQVHCRGYKPFKSSTLQRSMSNKILFFISYSYLEQKAILMFRQIICYNLFAAKVKETTRKASLALHSINYTTNFIAFANYWHRCTNYQSSGKSFLPRQKN